MEEQNHHQFNRQFKDLSNDVPVLNEDIPVSDSRYRNIVNRLDAMFELLLQQPDKDLGVDFDQLLDAMMEHIGFENDYMSMVCFPGALEHHLHHKYICTKTAELRHRIGKGEVVLHEDVSYVRILWLTHIRMYDRAFEEFLAC
jgi:hemerythrin